VNTFRYASICDGIGAVHVAWKPLGWQCAWTSEIAPFPAAVVEQRWGFPNLGDMTAITQEQISAYGQLSLLVGGTPCQSFSVAGLRKGLADPRGNLALAFLGLADKARPHWVVWENVPGVLSVDRGEAFGSILGGLGELGYGWAYRILDAQYVRVDGYERAVPQRRRRVFVVGHLGDWRRAAAVLFERCCLSGNPAPRREAGQGLAADVVGSLTASGGGTERTGESRGQDPVVAHSLRGEGHDASEDGTGRGVPLWPCPVAATLDAHYGDKQGLGDQHIRGGQVSLCLTSHYAKGGDPEVDQLLIANEGGFSQPTPFDTTQITSPENGCNPQPGAPCHPLAARAHPPAIAFGWQNSSSQGDSVSDQITPSLDKSKTPAVAFQSSQSGVREGETHATLDANNGSRRHNGAITQGGVRRLTPRECERLQGFPDDFTAITYKGKPAADSPRYKALGNSMAVNAMRWIGRRIQMMEEAADQGG
jgi:DNA (cytosine-5)-methyltransferase 1